MFFEGFDRRRIAIGDAEINLVTGGKGPPLLLLHGFPQTLAMWHQVAPGLAGKFTLVMPDLPGYGASKGPAPDAGNVNYSKRHTAQTMVRLMAELGHEKFLLAGHDRGGRVAYRLALDHPERVAGFAPLDIVPTVVEWEGMNWERALNSYHWLFLAQPALAEHMIGKDPDFYINHLLNRWAGRRQALSAEAVAEYVQAYRQPSVIAATCADYRAGASIDVEHDKADRDAGKRIRCPVMVVWGRGYLAKKAKTPLATWKLWAEEASETALDCGHFVAEEEPAACAEALLRFLDGRL